MDDAPNPHLKRAILETVDNQLKANDPPAVRKTLKRLMAEGYSKQESKELIAYALIHEIWEIGQGREFDKDRYVSRLNDLP